MNIHFSGDVSDLEPGIRILSGHFPFQPSDDGFLVHVERHDRNEIHISKSKTSAVIKYPHKIHFFRALGLFLENSIEKMEFEIMEIPRFERNGIFFDVSQGNAVVNPDTMREVFTRMSIMGLNWFILYMEDSFVIQKEPFFGYMRGKYTYEELKALDEFADALGIEVIPAIQTLAHLKDVLKWPRFNGIREDEDTLLVGEPKTYEFIEEAIVSAMAPFRTKRIHIGMDEAWKLGLGEYLIRNGLKTKFEIMTEHLKQVVSITERRGLIPMMFSDMYFRTPGLGGYGNNYDPEVHIPDEIKRNIPKGVQMNFWEYNQDQQAFYEAVIDKHKEICDHTVFAGGIWNWLGFGVNYGITFRTTNAALYACKAKGVTEVFATHWGDDTTENQIFSTMLGWQLYAEHGYADRLEPEKLKKRFEFCAGGKFDDYMNIKYMDEVPGVSEDNMRMSNPSKYLLWQNIMMGMFDKNVEGLNLNDYYRRLADQMRDASGRNGKFNYVFELLAQVCSVLSIKAEIGLMITKAYQNKDHEQLQHIVQETLPELRRRVANLHVFHREVWHKTNKPFGWEIADTRYGGLLMGIDTAMARIGGYLNHKLPRIEELEEKRMPYAGNRGIPAIYDYDKMFSASRISH